MAEKMLNLDLSPIRKKRITINGDENRILELNTSDLNIVVRAKEAYPKLLELANRADKISDTDTAEPNADILDTWTSEWEKIDTEMRGLLDYLFDSNVSEMCAPFGSMYDPVNGKFRFEWIIDILSDLYEKELQAEFQKTTKRVEKHTAKYVKKK